MSAKFRRQRWWIRFFNTLTYAGGLVFATMIIYGFVTGFADYVKSKYRQGFEEGMRAESMLRDGKKLDHGTLRDEGWRE